MFEMNGFEFIGAVAGALAAAAPVLHNLGDIALGGKRIWEFADRVYEFLGKRVAPAQIQVVLQQELVQYATLPQNEFDKKVDTIVAAVLRNASPDDRKAAAEYIKLIPAKVRASFARPEDPSGTSIPMKWVAASAGDLIPFLPPRPPMFKAGDSPPQAPNWILTKRIAIGGFGEVWQARGRVMEDSLTAFKFCLDPLSKTVLRNELKNIELVQNKLSNQPNIVKLLDAHLDGEFPWLRYEYVDGGDLASLMATWDDDDAVRAAMAVEKIGILAATLAPCHQGFQVRGERRLVIHRDMKPANVLVDTETGMLKITDFGIGNIQARHALDEAARIATVSGMSGRTPTEIRWANTPMYASPQQKDGLEPHPADDVHALGVMLYQMILGNASRPLQNDYISILENKNVCRPLIELVTRCIASDRERRIQHGGELAEALRALPKALVVKPVVLSQADRKRALSKTVDAWFAEADARNAVAGRHLERGDWAAAVKILESIPHPRMRDPDHWARATALRDGKPFVDEQNREEAMSLVRNPARALIAMECVWTAIWLISFIVAALNGPPPPSGVWWVFFGMFATSAIGIWAGFGMLRLRNYWLAVAGSLLVMPCFLVLGMPIGILSLIRLARPEVRSAFR